MSEPLAHRHYDTFELPETPDAPGGFLRGRLAISFSTDREGDIASLAVPFEPLGKDIVFIRMAGGDCTSPAFRRRCVGTYRYAAIAVAVAQDSDGQLTWTPAREPTYKLRPYRSRTFVIAGYEGFRVEFHLGPDGQADEVIMHYPHGTFVARRTQVSGGGG